MPPPPRRKGPDLITLGAAGFPPGRGAGTIRTYMLSSVLSDDETWRNQMRMRKAVASGITAPAGHGGAGRLWRRPRLVGGAERR